MKLSRSEVRIFVLGCALMVGGCSGGIPPTESSFSIQCDESCSFSTFIENPPAITVSGHTSHSTIFSIENTGNIIGTASLTCRSGTAITCGSVSPTSLRLAPGASGSVKVNWTAGTCCRSALLNLIDNTGGGRGIQQVTIQ